MDCKRSERRDVWYKGNLLNTMSDKNPCFVVKALNREPMVMNCAIQELIAEGRKRAEEEGLARPWFFKISDSNGQLFRLICFNQANQMLDLASGPGRCDPFYLLVYESSGSGKQIRGRLDVQYARA